MSTAMRTRFLTGLLAMALMATAPLSASPLPGRLVDTGWMDRNLNRPGLVVVDVRQTNAYLAGHIPGAINIPLHATFGRAPHGDLIASHRDIGALFSKSGIGNDDAVVLYDDGGFIDAARALWVFEVYGHGRVALLDGGMPAWQADGGASDRKPTTRPRTQYVPTVDPARLATRLSTRLAMDDPRAQLIDARAAPEYLGQESKSRHKGHIPGAVNIPSDANYEIVNGTPRLKSMAELRSLYGDIPPDKRVITYCNKGRDSALTHFVLRELGYEVSAYDGGWYEWGNRDDTPIAGPGQ